MTEDEVVGWHHRLNGHEFAQTLGDSEGQGSLVCYSPQGRRESDTTEGLTLSLHCQGRSSFYFSSSVQSLSCVRLFATPLPAARQASL